MRLTATDAIARAMLVHGYMSPRELAWLAETAAAYTGPITWVEVGSWHGRSATAVALALPPGSTLHLIDNFSGPTTREHPDPASILAALQATVATWVRDDISVYIHQVPSLTEDVSAALLVPPHSIDVLFLDGDHKYAIVQREILAYRPLLRPGALLCGHDYSNVCGVEQAVWELVPGAVSIPGTAIFAGRIRHLTHSPWTLSDLCVRLVSKQATVWTRWGDGEWNAIFGKRGANCDGHRYSPELGADLQAVLLDEPTYLLGLQGLAMREYGHRITSWLERRRIWPSWNDADLLHRASGRGQLGDFFAAVHMRETILVGPAYLDALTTAGGLLTPVARVVVPDQNCYEALNETLGQVRLALKQHPGALVLASMSMATNVLLHRLARCSPGVSALDCGSVWDPYVGRVSRAYHAALVRQEAVAKP